MSALPSRGSSSPEAAVPLKADNALERSKDLHGTPCDVSFGLSPMFL